MLTSLRERQRERLRIDAVIERRLLINYRLDPELAAALLPPPFEPHLVGGWAVAGLCLLRLGGARPRGLPPGLGLRSENVAHRVAMRWRDSDGTDRTGVYVPSRHSASVVNVAAGDRVVPGPQQRASFHVAESPRDLRIRIRADGAAMEIDVDGTVCDHFAGSPLFPTLADASAFFRSSPVGYSPSRRRPGSDGVELVAHGWNLAPVDIGELRSTFYDDRQRFPAGRIAFDSAFVMNDVPVTWRRVDRC